MPFSFRIRVYIVAEERADTKTKMLVDLPTMKASEEHKIHFLAVRSVEVYDRSRSTSYSAMQLGRLGGV